jgi:hypothetical protein
MSVKRDERSKNSDYQTDIKRDIILKGHSVQLPAVAKMYNKLENKGTIIQTGSGTSLP